MQFNTYTVAGAQVAVWLVNQPRPGAPELASVLAGYDVHEPAVTAGDAAALRPWAMRLRAVFEADGPPQRAGLADALLTAADCRPRLVSHGPGLPFHLHYAPAGSGLPARVRALTAAGIAHVIDEGEGARLRACGRDGCGTAFLDTSRNGRRVFCSVRCANQVNVASHRRRRRLAAAPLPAARLPAVGPPLAVAPLPAADRAARA
jgi:predicted RNA-binding Zn ribbon-like protein